MEWSPSYEALLHSSSPEITPLLWNLKLHYRVHRSLPSPMSRASTFRNKLFSFYSEELLTPLTTPKLEKQPFLSAYSI
jgi:hypothetical protein